MPHVCSWFQKVSIFRQFKTVTYEGPKKHYLCKRNIETITVSQKHLKTNMYDMLCTCLLRLDLPQLTNYESDSSN